MRPCPLEIVDPHMHHWKLTAHPWYPVFTEPGAAGPEHDLGLGDPTAILRDYLPDDYVRDSAGVGVTATVHVSATNRPRAYLDELPWIASLAEEHGLIQAVIGSMEPTLSAAEMEADLDAQAASPLLRGLRILTGFDPGNPAIRALLTMLRERDLLLDLVITGAQAATLRPMLDELPGLRIVVEHAGWPHAAGDAAFRAWRAGMAQLAGYPDVTCKISGLAMRLHSVDAAVQRPWIETCIELFGSRRCMFASNFPVDGLYGTFDDLYATYRAVSAGLGDDERTALFSTTAVTTYRL